MSIQLKISPKLIKNIADLYNDTSEEIKKGVSKVVVKHEINHEDYKKVSSNNKSISNNVFLSVLSPIPFLQVFKIKQL